MRTASTFAERSTCLRLQVGAVIARDGRIISVGYAGSPSGTPHCNPDNCTPEQPCLRTIHAEANCVAFAARYGISTEGAEIYVTHAPCLDCAKLLINAGLIRVWFRSQYRNTIGIEKLREAGVVCAELPV